MELKDYPAWRRANLFVFMFIVACAVVHMIPERAVWFGLMSGENLRLTLTVAGSVYISRLADYFIRAIEQYQPCTPIQAKRANEQIKLTATFANIIAGALISVVALRQSISSASSAQGISAFTAMLFAALIHMGARSIVGLIKDESPVTAAE
ncbi:hypothetical protein EWH08_11055 [Sphingobium indicum]|uniref:Uncharacterized protein n=2 Tax=Sphingobium indicum TaxID=332055 RepID=A0A1L5BT50_SPHIB|nr:hypothetical protein [Sphingobium indicum]APL95987.1 hypothetical protein SIDU_16525 [Sphingobium indicum B90A]KEZ00077.1 hypothetical protein AI27_14690 [Sphingomonas sp. BHC-A]NYI23083.1 hypothetical protein [Sphingobium indicum]RYM01840.1 hypothetical protein EWH08_11055 [Sphingobium indicum]